MKTYTVKVVLLIGICVLWISCASKPKPGFVYRDWSQRMSEMGIFPVFPPREDVAVGDVYLLPTHPYDASMIEVLGGAGNAGFHKQNLFADQNWTDKELSLFQLLTNYYSSRPILSPINTNSDAAAVTPLAGPQPILTNRQNVFESVPLTRLKQVAFPDFAVTTVDQASASAMVPIEGIRASFGFSSANVSRISFKIPQAESYGLPSDYLLHDFIKKDVSGDSAGVLYILAGFLSEGEPRLARAEFNDSAYYLEKRLKGSGLQKFKAALKESSKYVYVAVISEVYYARSIDISVEFTKARQSSASARPMGIEEVATLARYLKGTNASVSGAATPAPSDGSSNTATNSSQTPDGGSGLLNIGTNLNVFDIVAQMRTNNIEMSGIIPGGQVKVVSISQTSVGLRRVFEQPVAVGVRGLLLKVELNAQNFTSPDGIARRGFKIVTEVK